jgi:large subunit ribosomal protein L10
MLRTDKERIVTELADQLGTAETLIVADYRGLTNKQLEGLRDTLLEHGARFRIVKNSLTRRAAEQAGAEALLVMLDGPTAIAFIESGGDPAAVAKALAATARESNVLTLRGGVLEGNTLTGDEINRLATLPPIDVLRGQLVAAVVAPLTQLVALVAAPLRDLHGLIDARIKQLEEEGQVAAPEPAAEAAPAEAEESDTEAEPAAEAAPVGTDENEAADAEEPAEAEQAETPADSASAEPASPDEENEPTVEPAEQPESTEEEEEA